MTRQASGTLTSTVPVQVGLGELSCPITLTLNSSAAGRKIELSTNNGASFFQPQADLSSTTFTLIVTVTAPVTHAKFTGQANDTWVVA